MIDMQAISLHTLATALALAVAATLAGRVKAGGELVNFPENYAEGVHYATVDRGNRRQAMKSVQSVGVWLETIIDHIGGGAEPGRHPGQNRRDREPAEAVRCRKRRPRNDPAGCRSPTAGSARL